MKLVFLEFVDEARAFLDHIERTNQHISDFAIICLSLQPQIFLKSQGIQYETTLSFFDNDSHKRCLLKSDSLVNLMEEKLGFPKNPEDINGYKDSYVYFISYLNNHLLSLIETVSNAAEAGQPEIMIACRPGLSDYCDSFLTPKERYLSHIVERVAKNKGISFLPLPISLRVGKKRTNISTPPSNVKLAAPKNDKLLLVPSCAYGLHRVIKEIKQIEKGVTVVYVHEGGLSFHHKLYYRLFKGIDEFVRLETVSPDPIYSRIGEDLEKAVKTLRGHAEIFEHRGIPFLDLIEPKISEGVSSAIKDLAMKGASLSHAVRTLRPSLSLSYSSKNLTYILGEVCRNNGLEALCISHGTVVPPKNDVEGIVNKNIGTAVILNRYPSVAVQTPWCEKFLKHYKHPSKDIITGPLLFKTGIKKRKKAKTKTLVHAVTLKTRSSTKFWGVETADEFIDSVRSLIRSVKNIENARLLVHLHPAYGHLFSKNELELLLPKSDCYSVVYSGSVYDSLSKADFLVSFSSTTIEEATMNRIPVILFDKWGRYKHFDAVDLGKEGFRPYPAYYAGSEELLAKNLPTIISKGTSEAVNEADWSVYSYPKSAKNGFINYLHQCFR